MLVFLHLLVNKDAVMLIYMVFVDINVRTIPPLKHIIDQVATGQNASTVQSFDLAVGTLNPDPYTSANNVRNGSIITAMIIELDVADQGLVSGSFNFDWYVWFNIAGAQTIVNPAGGVNISKTKNQIFHQDGSMDTRIVFTSASGFAPWVHKWRTVISIPRSYQQINDLDKIQFVYVSSNNTATLNLKLRVIYKEIFP